MVLPWTSSYTSYGSSPYLFQFSCAFFSCLSKSEPRFLANEHVSYERAGTVDCCRRQNLDCRPFCNMMNFFGILTVLCFPALRTPPFRPATALFQTHPSLTDVAGAAATFPVLSVLKVRATNIYGEFDEVCAAALRPVSANVDVVTFKGSRRTTWRGSCAYISCLPIVHAQQKHSPCTKAWLFRKLSTVVSALSPAETVQPRGVWCIFFGYLFAKDWKFLLLLRPMDFTARKHLNGFGQLSEVALMWVSLSDD